MPTTIRPTVNVTRNVPTGRLQPSRGMFGFSRLPEYRSEMSQQPIGYTPAEAVSDVIQDFNRAPVSYTTGPNGEIIATRSMARPQAPGNLGPTSPNVGRIFAPPNRNAPTGNYQTSSRGMFGSRTPEYESQPVTGSPLTASWVLPKPEGPRIFNRMIPSSDEERSMFANSGYRGTPSASFNPSRLLSEDYLRVPLREGTSGFNEPVFGSVTDYPTRRVLAPNVSGTYGQEFAQMPGRGFSSPGYDSTPAMQALNRMNTKYTRRF
jgi:hypothetical protein